MPSKRERGFLAAFFKSFLPERLATPLAFSLSSTWHFFLAILWRMDAFSRNFPEREKWPRQVKQRAMKHDLVSDWSSLGGNLRLPSPYRSHFSEVGGCTLKAATQNNINTMMHIVYWWSCSVPVQEGGESCPLEVEMAVRSSLTRGVSRWSKNPKQFV